MVTLDFTASGGSVQTSGAIAYNAASASVKEILEVLFYALRETRGVGGGVLRGDLAAS